MDKAHFMRELFIGMLLFCSVYLVAQQNYSCIVLDAESLPLEGVVVTLEGQTQVSDEDGKVLFTEIPPGVHRLSTRSVGYQTMVKDVRAGQNDTLTLLAEVYQIETVELNAAWIKDDQPFTHENLTATDLEKLQVGQDVPFLLRWLPSMVVTSDAGTGIGYTGLRIRGSDPSRINVTIDGVPVNDSESQGVFWVDLPDLSTSAASIQVQRGVGTSTNGAGAFGGTINVKTKSHRPRSFGVIDVSAGSFGTLRGNLQFGSGTIRDHFNFEGRVSTLTSDGYIDRGKADLQSIHLAGRYFSDRHSLKISLYDGKEITYQAWNGVPQQYINDSKLRTFNTAGTRSSGFHPDEVDNYRQTHLHAILKQQISEALMINATAHYTKGRGYFEQYRVDDDLAEYDISAALGDSVMSSSDLIRRRWLDNDFYGAILSMSNTNMGSEIEWSFGGGLNKYLGGHFGEVIWSRFAGLSEKGHEYYRNKAEKTDANLYGQLQAKIFGGLQGFMDLQWRHVDYQFVGFDTNLSQIDQRVKHHFFNPKIGATYSSGASEYYYSMAVAHREPNRSDYVDSSPSTRPLPERLVDHELGIRYSKARLSWHANWYYMSYKNQLALTGRINDVGEYTRINVPKSFRTGFETQLDWLMHPRLQVSGNASWSLNRIASFTEAIDNWDTGLQDFVDHEAAPLSFSPSVVSGGVLSYELAKSRRSTIHLNSYHKYVGSQYLDNTGNPNSQLASYYFSDLHFIWQWQLKWAEEMQVKILLRNILDRKIVSNGWIYRYISPSYDATNDDPHAFKENGSTYNLKGLYPQAGRNIMIGLTLKF